MSYGVYLEDAGYVSAETATGGEATTGGTTAEGNMSYGIFVNSGNADIGTATGGEAYRSVGATNAGDGTINVREATGADDVSMSCGAAAIGGSGTINVGTAAGGSYGVLSQSSGTVNVGTASVGTGTGEAYAVSNFASGTINAGTAASTNGTVNTDTATLTLNKGTGASCVLDSITVAATGDTTIGRLPQVTKDGTVGVWYTDAGKSSACGTTVDGSTVTALYSTFCVKPVSGWDGSAADTTWYTGHESDTGFTINTEAALAGLSSLVNAGTTDFEGDTITLSSDIDLAGHAWTPIGTTDHPFKGTFDGGYNTITGLAIGMSASADSTITEAGLFGCTGAEASIQNVSIVNTAIYSSVASALVGGLVGNNAGGIASCSVSGTIETTGKKAYVGGVAGNSTGPISDCTSAANVTGGVDACVGGIVGYGSSGITSCSTSGNISVGAMNNDYPSAGGIVGYLFNTTDGTLAVTDCHATGTVSGTSYGYVGGLAGYCNRQIIGSYATGAVTDGQLGVAGGLVGVCDCSVTDSYATGAVTAGAGSAAGGLAGWTNNFAVKYSWASGDVIVTGDLGSGGPLGGNAAGGLVGITWSYQIAYCYATGNVSGTYFVGGLAGYNKSGDKLNIVNCYASGSASGTSIYYQGGMIAHGSSTVLSNCYWNGEKNTAAFGCGVYTGTLTEKTTSEMQTADFAQLLTDGSGGNCTWIDIPGANNGYPLISGVGYAVLSDLAVSSGTLSPAFSGTTTDYSLTVENGVSSVTLTPATGDTAAAITVNGAATASGSASAAVSLAAGATTDIPVVISDGPNPITYTVHVTCAAAYGISLDKADTYTFPALTVGYAAPTPLIVTVTNTGSQPTGVLTATLSGVNGDSFALSAGTLDNIGAGGTASFTVAPKTGLAYHVGGYTATVTVSGANLTPQSFGVSFLVTGAPASEFTLSQTGTHTFSTQTVGYTTPTPLTVTATNTGGQPTGALTATLSGANADSFALSAGTLDNISTGGTASFTVAPRTGLAAGDYTATVTVAGNTSVPQSFGVRFTVSSSDSWGSGAGGGGSTTSTPTVTTTINGSGSNAVTTSRTSLTGTTSGGTQTVPVTSGTMASLTDAAKTAEAAGGRAIASIDTGTGSNLKDIGVTIPGAQFDTFAAGTDAALQFSTGLGTVTFSSGAVDTIGEAGAGDVAFRMGIVGATSLNTAQQQTVGNRPVYSFSVTVGGTAVSRFESDVSVSIPYTLGANENPNAIVVYYLDAAGSLQTMLGAYNAATGAVSFVTTHFSDYVIGYNKVTFNDVASTAWCYNAVTFVAARGVTTGADSGNFRPDATLTRGQFLVMVMRAYGIPADSNPTNNFTDAGNTYYTGYLAAAKRLGISNGVGDNLFAPNKAITCQGMFTLLYNTLKAIDRLPTGDNGRTLSDFSDSGSVAAYAQEALAYLVKTGIVSGSNGRLGPTNTTTRAQLAQVLYNLLSK